MKAANARERLSGRVKTGLGTTNEEIEFAAQATIAEHGTIPPLAVGARFRIRPESVSSIPKGISAAQQDGLSARAENVLKELAAELIGENPLKGRWIPSSELLRKITFRDLLTARNCGPQTIDEIVRWAKSQGVISSRRSTPANHCRRYGGILLQNLRRVIFQRLKLRKR